MGTRVGVAMYDSVTDTAFGPVFEDEGSAGEFLDWCLEWHDDPRKFSPDELDDFVAEWRRESEAEECAETDREVAL